MTDWANILKSNETFGRHVGYSDVGARFKMLQGHSNLRKFMLAIYFVRLVSPKLMTFLCDSKNLSSTQIVLYIRHQGLRSCCVLSTSIANTFTHFNEAYQNS